MAQKEKVPLSDEAKGHLRAFVENGLKNTSSDFKFRLFAFLQTNRDYRIYRSDPYKYIREVLRKRLVAKQIEFVRALGTNNRVHFRGSQYYGASFLAGCLANWFFDACVPSTTLIVATTEDLLINSIWAEVRTSRQGRPGLSPKAPRLEMNYGHYVQGLTAKDITTFEPKRDANLLIIFDRAHDIPEEFWKKAENVLSGANVKFAAFYRPTKESGFIRTFERTAKVIEANALEHPNIAPELLHKPPKVENAVRLTWIEYMLAEHAVESKLPDPKFDIEWQGKWYRPEPEFESNVLARWPLRAKDSGYNLNPAVAAPESANEAMPADYETMIGETLSRAKEISNGKEK